MRIRAGGVGHYTPDTSPLDHPEMPAVGGKKYHVPLSGIWKTFGTVVAN